MLSRAQSTIIIIVSTILILTISINTVYSEKEYVINTNYPVPLVINGIEVQPPVKAYTGDIICVKELIVYLHQSKRLVFREWSDGVLDQCRVVEGNLTALYDVEVLLQVYAELKSLRKSEWVKAGTLVNLDYPEYIYEDENTRYAFESWSSGEKPFQPNNTIYISDPIRLEVKYVKQYFINAIGTNINGTGWYREGETVILAAPPEIYDSSKVERLIFTKWESIGSSPVIISNPTSPIIMFQAKGPHTLRAVYETQYKIEIKGPRGVIYKGWVRDGETLKISVDPIINLEEGVRLRFVDWGLSDLPRIPDVTIQVHQPLNITANYVKQYYLTVESQYGAGGSGWYDEGSIAIVRVNPQPPSNVLINRRFIGFSGDCEEQCQTEGHVLQVKMDSPKTIRGIYTVEPNILSIGIITGIGGALVAVYAFTSKRRREILEERVEEKIKISRPSKILRDPSKALYKCAECGAVIRGEVKALKHVKGHGFEHPVIEYTSLEEIAEPISDRTAVLWSNGLRLRITPPDQLTVKDLVKPGDIVRHSESDEKLRVVSVEKHEKHGLPVFTIVGTSVEKTSNRIYRYINDLVAQEGEIFCIYEDCDCQVYIVKKATVKPAHPTL
ncbi:MAG: hypothetical protein NZ929_01255 [Aigarchaeota archaeon]|nr:hypothetical protein [Aigarchaeota archaeon]MDW7985884.1 hypothetical protein [Nitrososphaerota archaeon]